MRHRGVVASVGSTPSFTVSGGSGGTDFPYAPIVVARSLPRTLLVPQGDDVIDLASEVAWPDSPTTTNWLVEGADSVHYEQVAANKIAVKASARASISPGSTKTLTITPTNSYGAGPSAVLSIFYVADADCRFVSYGAGSDGGNGLTPATAWKHVPFNSDFTGTNGTALGAGKVIFFKAEIHRTALIQSDTFGLPHGGSGGGQFTYCATGWGGRASLDGSDTVTVGVAPSQVEAGGNASYASMKKITLDAAGAWYRHLYDNDTMLYPGQWPSPSVLKNHLDPTVDATGGMFRVANTSSSGTTPRMYLTSSGPSDGVVSVVDARIAARYGNVALGSMPPYMAIWGPGNEVNVYALVSYNFATSTITCQTGTSTALATTNGETAFAMIGHPLDVVQGQWAFQLGSTTNLVAWLPNGGTVSYSVRTKGVVVDTDYVDYVGFIGQRYCGLADFTGIIFDRTHSSPVTRVNITDSIIRQNRSRAGSGCGLTTSNGGFTDTNVDRMRFEENPDASGLRIPVFQGLQGTPTPSQVRAYPYGKVRGIYVPQYGIGRTGIYVEHATGVQITQCFFHNLTTVHGNCISLYPTGADVLAYNVVDYNTVINCIRPLTTEREGGTFANRHTHLEGNVLLASGSSLALEMNAGEGGGKFRRNLCMGGADFIGSGDLVNIAEGLGIDMEHNVLAGLHTSGTPRSYTGGSLIYSIISNHLTRNSCPADVDATKVANDNDLIPGAPIVIWNQVLTTEMNAKLGPGPLGAFWNVAA